MKGTLLIIYLLTINSIAQNSRFQFETYIGTQSIHHHKCSLDDKDIHRGCTGSAGVRLNFDLSKRFTLVTGLTYNNLVGDNLMFPKENIFRLDLKYSIGHFNKLKALDFTIETGVEYVSNFKFFKFPFYLGTQIHLNKLLDWNSRFKIPSILVLSDAIGTFDYIEVSFETGLSYRLISHPKPQFSSRNGNPFILQ